MNEYLMGEVPKEKCGHPDSFGHYVEGRARCSYCGKFMDELKKEQQKVTVKEALEKGRAYALDKGKCYILVLDECCTPENFENNPLIEGFPEVVCLFVPDVGEVKLFELEKELREEERDPIKHPRAEGV